MLYFLNLAWLNAQIEERNNDPSDRHSIQATIKTGESFLTPKFASGTLIKAGDNLMKVDTYTSVPCVVDWNEDGKKDLRVGCFYDGNVYFFNNSGSDISSQAVKAARTNFLCLPDGNRINLTVMDFHRLENLKVLCKKV